MAAEDTMQANVFTGDYDGRPRLRWQNHVVAAVTDLRNSDRSPFEQVVYDALRSIMDQAGPQR